MINRHPSRASAKRKGHALSGRGRRLTPASSRTSAVRYSSTAVTYTAALAPTRILFWVFCLRNLLTRPQGNYIGELGQQKGPFDGMWRAAKTRQQRGWRSGDAFARALFIASTVGGGPRDGRVARNDACDIDAMEADGFDGFRASRDGRGSSSMSTRHDGESPIE